MKYIVLNNESLAKKLQEQGYSVTHVKEEDSDRVFQAMNKVTKKEDYLVIPDLKKPSTIYNAREMGYNVGLLNQDLETLSNELSDSKKKYEESLEFEKSKLQDEKETIKVKYKEELKVAEAKFDGLLGEEKTKIARLKKSIKDIVYHGKSDS